MGVERRGRRVVISQSAVLYVSTFWSEDQLEGSNKQDDLQRRKQKIKNKKKRKGGRSCRCYDLKKHQCKFFTRSPSSKKKAFYFCILMFLTTSHLKLCFKSCRFYCVLTPRLQPELKGRPLFQTKWNLTFALQKFLLPWFVKSKIKHRALSGNITSDRREALHNNYYNDTYKKEKAAIA